MKSFIQLRILLLIFTIVLATVITKESKAQDGTWDIGPRTLPAAVDVSDILRESLLGTLLGDVETAKAVVFKTDEEWEAWVKEGDVASSAAARALADALSVTIKQEKIGGVNIYRVTPPEIDEDHKNHIIIYIHGGAWVRNGGVA